MSGGTGNLFVIAAPSGAGKTSRTRSLLEREPELKLSVSYTTRPPRPAEREGVDYHFVTPQRFMELKADGEFLEHAHVHGNWYATSSSWLKGQVIAGHDVLLEIDWQVAAQVRGLVTDSVHRLILPPALQSLEGRLVSRSQDDLPSIGMRR